MRNFNGKVNKGTPISFEYSKPGEPSTRRSGLVEQVKRSAGKSSIKAHRGQKVIVFTVKDGDTIKSYHFNRMSSIKVGG